MTPATFPESNRTIGKPADWDESQCGGIRAFVGNLQGGTLDGCPIFVTAWNPTLEEIEAIKNGAKIYLTWCTGVLAPHTVTTNFKAATTLQ
jgi:hypothetical protein